MSKLRDLQSGFSRHVFNATDSGFTGHIKANGIDPEQRLQIYRNNTYISLSDSLRATYPVVQRLVGEGFFRYATYEYITHYPSYSGDLHEFGGYFAEFLSTFKPVAGLAYLPDVARLEWCYEQAFYGPEHPPLDPTTLAEVPQNRYEDLKFSLNPAARLLASDYPVLRIWQVNQEVFDKDQTVDLGDGGIQLLVIRNHDLDVEIKPLGEGEFELLQALANGCSFAVACARALNVQPDCDISSCFQRHVLENIVVDFSI